MHSYYINKIIESDDNKKMEELKELLEDTITYLKGTDYDKYEKIECKLYEIVEGKKLSEEKAKEWVSKMVPPAKWTMTETNDVKTKFNVDIPSIDFFVLMNMLYSDYGDVIGETIDNTTLEKYIKFAEDWYYDEDVNKDGAEKLYSYYKYIVD